MGNNPSHRSLARIGLMFHTIELIFAKESTNAMQKSTLVRFLTRKRPTKLGFHQLDGAETSISFV